MSGKALNCDGRRCQLAPLALARSVAQRRHIGAKLLYDPVSPYVPGRDCYPSRPKIPMVGCFLSFFDAAVMITLTLAQTLWKRGLRNFTLKPLAPRAASAFARKILDTKRVAQLDELSY